MDEWIDVGGAKEDSLFHPEHTPHQLPHHWHYFCNEMEMLGFTLGKSSMEFHLIVRQRHSSVSRVIHMQRQTQIKINLNTLWYASHLQTMSHPIWFQREETLHICHPPTISARKFTYTKCKACEVDDSGNWYRSSSWVELIHRAIHDDEMMVRRLLWYLLLLRVI